MMLALPDAHKYLLHSNYASMLGLIQEKDGFIRD